MTQASNDRRAHRLAIGDGILIALEERAERARRAGRWAEAERFVHCLLGYDAGRRSAKRLLGQICLASGRYREAFEVFRSLCEECRGDAWIACRAGEALLYAGELRAAQRWLAYAVEFDAAQDARSHRRARILLQRARRRRKSR